MQKAFCSPETSVRILVRPTIGRLLYIVLSQSGELLILEDRMTAVNHKSTCGVNGKKNEFMKMIYTLYSQYCWYTYAKS